MPAIRCPFCRNTIDDAATVCGHCGRDVGRVLALEARVRKLETRVTEGADGTGEAPADGARPWVTRGVILGYYGISVLLAVLVSLTDLAVPLETLDILLAVPAGLVIGLLAPAPNFWVLLFLGVLQPFVRLVFLLLAGLLRIDDLVGWGEVFISQALWIGAAMSVAGLVAVAIRRRRIPPEFWASAPVFALWESSESGLERVEKLLLRIAAVGTAIGLVLGRLFGSGS